MTFLSFIYNNRDKYNLYNHNLFFANIIYDLIVMILKIKLKNQKITDFINLGFMISGIYPHL